MRRPTVFLDLAGDHALARDLVAGGVFVPGCDAKFDEDCELVVHVGDEELRVAARVVWVDGARGAGLQLSCDAEMKQRIAALANIVIARPRSDPVPVPDPVPDPDPDPDPRPDSETETAESPRLALNAHERLRNLTLAQQIKIAHKGEVSERIVLERMYGKTVWEALLRNPRVTNPEVARIARMGALPRPLIEIIVANGAWLQIPEIRRALLANPRLGTDQIIRVLRLLPKHELKIAAIQTGYSNAVRDAARKLIRDNA